VSHAIATPTLWLITGTSASRTSLACNWLVGGVNPFLQVCC
jgi:hypothetical protein